jgi:hypothetical protein
VIVQQRGNPSGAALTLVEFTKTCEVAAAMVATFVALAAVARHIPPSSKIIW